MFGAKHSALAASKGLVAVLIAHLAAGIDPANIEWLRDPWL